MGKNAFYAKIKDCIRKTNTNKTISKIVQNTQKVDVNINRRKKLKIHKPGVTAREAHADKLKFGSINVDGLDLKTVTALRDLLVTRGFDIR